MSRTKKIDPNATFQSPRAAAYLTGLSVGYIRDGCRENRIPHVMVGSDMRINMPLFLARLNEESVSGENYRTGTDCIKGMEAHREG